jgi:uncharacterized protein (DUF2141 family)
MKKFISYITAIALVASLATVAFALNTTTGSITVPVYGSLTGTVRSDGSYLTSVTINPDNARLTITGLIQNSVGQNLVGSTLLRISVPGATSISAYWTYMPAGTYAIYGIHGVQGGGTNGGGWRSQFTPSSMYRLIQRAARDNFHVPFVT